MTAVTLVDCAECEGKGRALYEVGQEFDGSPLAARLTCAVCHGAGKVPVVCPECLGAGIALVTSDWGEPSDEWCLKCALEAIEHGDGYTPEQVAEIRAQAAAAGLLVPQPQPEQQQAQGGPDAQQDMPVSPAVFAQIATPTYWLIHNVRADGYDEEIRTLRPHECGGTLTIRSSHGQNQYGWSSLDSVSCDKCGFSDAEGDGGSRDEDGMGGYEEFCDAEYHRANPDAHWRDALCHRCQEHRAQDGTMLCWECEVDLHGEFGANDRAEARRLEKLPYRRVTLVDGPRQQEEQQQAQRAQGGESADRKDGLKKRQHWLRLDRAAAVAWKLYGTMWDLLPANEDDDTPKEEELRVLLSNINSGLREIRQIAEGHL